MDFESFVTHISEHGSPYSRGCVHGVLMDALDHLQELILDGKSVRLSDLGLFSIGMTSRGEESRDKVSAASVEGVHLIVRNTKNWSNSELRKKCKIESIDAKGTDAGDGSGDNGGGSGNTTGGNTTSGTDDGKTDPGNTDSGNTDSGKTDSGKTDGGGSDSNGDNEHIVL